MAAPENLIEEFDPDYVLDECICGAEDFFHPWAHRYCSHRYHYLFDQPTGRGKTELIEYL